MSSRNPTRAQRLRHDLVAAWRGVEDGPLMDLPTTSVAALLPMVLKQAGLAGRMQLEEVLAAWKSIVGEFLFQHSRPDSISRGVLMVRVLQPSVHHALTMERLRILKRLQQQMPDAGIKDVRLKHG